MLWSLVTLQRGQVMWNEYKCLLMQAQRHPASRLLPQSAR